MLTHIFNQSLVTGDLLKDWKTANNIPIYKKGDRTKADNYRSVSLTCVGCELLEHIVVSNMMKHVDKDFILSCFQHVFRAGHSCEPSY